MKKIKLFSSAIAMLVFFSNIWTRKRIAKEKKAVSNN